MLKIQRIMLNSEPTAGTDNGSPAWVEIENNAGEAPLASYCFRIQTETGDIKNCWQGGETDVLFGSGTLRLTDGSAKANPAPLAEPRLVIQIPGLDLRPARGGKLVLLWWDANGDVKENSVTVPSDAPAGVPLYLLGDTMTSPATQRYH